MGGLAPALAYRAKVKCSQVGSHITELCILIVWQAEAGPADLIVRSHIPVMLKSKQRILLFFFGGGWDSLKDCQTICWEILKLAIESNPETVYNSKKNLCSDMSNKMFILL